MLLGVTKTLKNDINAVFSPLEWVYSNIMSVAHSGCNQSPLRPPTSHRPEHVERRKRTWEDLPRIQRKVSDLKCVFRHMLFFFFGFIVLKNNLGWEQVARGCNMLRIMLSIHRSVGGLLGLVFKEEVD